MTLTWNVAPRYTAGSPAMVDEKTARRVAAQEQEALGGVLEGFHGDVARDQARSLGLAGIVWSALETRRGVLITDMITEERVDKEDGWKKLINAGRGPRSKTPSP